MPRYWLYLESGPRRKTTMVHVLDLLGCVANGPTTEEALARTPDAIRAFLALLARHNAGIDPEAGFTTTVVEHVSEGSFIGQGDPEAGFGPDFDPLSTTDLATYLDRLDWLGADLRDTVGKLPEATLTAVPRRGRTIARIVEHVAGAHCGYLRYTVGPVEGLREAMRSVEQDPSDAGPGLARIWSLTRARLQALTEAERNRVVPHGRRRWTPRRGLRRMLEHCWEHLREIEDRSAGAAV